MTRTFILACTFVTVFIAGLRGKTLDSLVVEGATVYQPQVIRNAAGLRAGQQFNAVDIQKAVKSLYNQGLFKDVEIFSLNETDSTASLLVKVEEYPITESIEFSGMKKLRESELNEAVTLRQGQVASDATLFENIRLIKDAYAEEGYLRAEISPELVKTKTPGNVIVKFNIEEGPRVRVESIRFGGNKAFSEKKLKREFKTNEKKWYNSGDFERQKYERHLDSLVMFYRNKGYLDAQIVSDSVWYGDENKNIFIEITLDEGPQYVVGDFYFTGTSVLEADSLQKNIALKTGKPFQQQKFDMSKLFIANAYREEGYLWVQLNENFRYRADTIDVVFNIAEGSPAIVNRIDIQGNEKTLEKVIRRELQLHPGQKYKQSRMERSIREIMQLNYFDNVTPDLQPNENGTIDLLVDVEEKENIGQFTAGLTYSGLDGLGGTFSVTIPNFQGAGQELSANVEYAKRRQIYSFGFKEPWLLGTPTSSQFNIFYEHTEYDEDETIQRYGLQLGAGRPLKWPDDYYRFFFNYRISWEDERWPEKTIGRTTYPQKGLLSRLSFTLERNDTDLPNFPTRGSKFFVTSEIAGLGGDYNYFKETVGYDAYFPLFWKFVLGTKSRFGFLGSFNEETRVSRYDVFSAGGVYYGGVVRGYGEEEFGGRNNPGEGNTMLTLNAELRFPVIDQQLYLGVFADMGNTWAKMSDVSLGDMYRGVGVGARLMFPMIGLLGFDFAWKLDNPDGTHFDNDPKDRFQFHFLMNKGF